MRKARFDRAVLAAGRAILGALPRTDAPKTRLDRMSLVWVPADHERGDAWTLLALAVTRGSQETSGHGTVFQISAVASTLIAATSGIAAPDSAATRCALAEHPDGLPSSFSASTIMRLSAHDMLALERLCPVERALALFDEMIQVPGQVPAQSPDRAPAR